MWGERVDATIYTFSNTDLLASFRKQLKKGKKSIIDIINELNAPNANNVTMKTGRFSKGDNEIIDIIEWQKGISKDIMHGGKSLVVEIKEIIAPQPKLLDEAKGIITADYQNFLEKSWIEQLRKKYPVIVNEPVLKTLWK